MMMNMTKRVKDWAYLLFAAAVLSSLMLLAGCVDNLMTRDNMIAAVKQCKEAGYDSFIVKSVWDGRVIDVQCLLKKPVKLSGGE